jgi:hypothetical protein
LGGKIVSKATHLRKEMGMRIAAILVAVLVAQCQYVTSYVSSPARGGLGLNKFMDSRFEFRRATCQGRHRHQVYASLEEDLGKPFGEFGRKVGKSIDWFFDTSHITGGIADDISGCLLYHR